MLKIFVRAMALVAAAVFSITALAAAPAQAETGVGPVPEDWGDPVYTSLRTDVVARESGSLPGRLGNQHVITIHIDDDDFMSGGIADWKCPAGVLPPLYSGAVEPTPCKIKGEENFDYAGVGDYTYAWSPTARWVNIRMPVSFSGGQQSRLSLRLKSADEPQLWWEEIDGYRHSGVGRDNAVVVGGKLLGRTWLSMDDVDTFFIGVDHVYAGAPV